MLVASKATSLNLTRGNLTSARGLVLDLVLFYDFPLSQSVTNKILKAVTYRLNTTSTFDDFLWQRYKATDFQHIDLKPLESISNVLAKNGHYWYSEIAYLD